MVKKKKEEEEERKKEELRDHFSARDVLVGKRLVTCFVLIKGLLAVDQQQTCEKSALLYYVKNLLPCVKISQQDFFFFFFFFFLRNALSY